MPNSASRNLDIRLHPGTIEREIEADGAIVRIHESDGDSALPTIVLVHGTGGSTRKHFWALFPMLAFEHRVIGIDLALPADGTPLTLDFYVRQVEAVLEQVRDDRGAALVGYSLGAVVALATAARRPDLVDQLVAIAGWMKTDRHQLQRHSLYRGLVRRAPELVPDFTLFASYSPPYISGRTELDFREIVERVHSGEPYPEPLVELNRSIDIVEQTQSIAVPSLVIGCTHDHMVQVRHSRQIYGAIADARYAEIEAGHAVVHERPAELFALIDRFVEDPREHPPGTVIPPDIA